MRSGSSTMSRLRAIGDINSRVGWAASFSGDDPEGDKNGCWCARSVWLRIIRECNQWIRLGVCTWTSSKLQFVRNRRILLISLLLIWSRFHAVTPSCSRPSDSPSIIDTSIYSRITFVMLRSGLNVHLRHFLLPKYEQLFLANEFLWSKFVIRRPRSVNLAMVYLSRQIILWKPSWDFIQEILHEECQV